ncbi:hypothetical protein PMZ80_004871 [Knufia obscura]|uniref:Anucleate primary sterigmata protein B n=1 Tax=Knufia obscura TaxID=1635080 RepID=A0ABR0RPX6_9EURO|nr:hypothetical protein PMZ80_004871 [Knufia obscura]
MSTPTRPRPRLFQRQSSRMVGGFEPGSDIRDDVSNAESAHDHDHDHEEDYAMDQEHSTGEDSSSLLPPQIDMPSSLNDSSRMHRTQHEDTQEEDDMPAFNNTVLEEEEMKKKLADFESSFLPEPSAMSDQVDSTAQSMPVDIFVPGFSDTQTTGGVPTSDQTPSEGDAAEDHNQDQAQAAPSPTTAGYITPTAEDDRVPIPDEDTTTENDSNREAPNTSALERMSSSPTAARTVSRVQSLASMAGYETANERERGSPESPTAHKARRRSRSADPDATPRKDRDRNSTLSSIDTSGTIRVNVEDYDAIPLNVTRRRPQYLSKRSSSARLSYDSMASSTTETSEATLGADFALQSGGAAPESTRSIRRKPNMTLSRSTSLGSLASGVSGMSGDDEESTTQQKRAAAFVPPELSTLQEESPTTLRHGRGSSEVMVTPRASSMKLGLSMPTDSVIANHVRDLEVPDTIARKFRDHSRSRSPDKNMSMASATMTPGPKKGLTLKEHRSTVEKLGKENFDLKMKIHFLDQALQKRSEDGIKEMITENVQLKSDRLRLEKDNHGLRKQIRELQRKLDEATGKNESDDQGYGTDDERSPTVEEEVLYLRERVEITEIEMEKLRQENINKEGEKRRLAEMVRNLGDSRHGGSEVGSREERDMWKDMLEAETIAREQAEDDARKLRDELSKIKQDSSRPGSKLRVVKGQIVSRSSSVDGTQQKVDTAELERLRHECSELQKTIGAQASALTSRNKEKEMLYQEIENLKLGKMGGVRSVAGDSILDRSASRARSNSRASNGTRYTRMSDNERETMENRIDQLRDEISQLKLDKQNTQSQFDEALAELDAVDAQAQADADQFNEELAILTQERDNAMRDAEEQDHAFQQLKTEAQEEIDGLGDELDAKIEECTRLEQDLKAQASSAKALQAEMRSAAEGLQRLEEDAQQNLAKYQAVKAELDDSNRELENLEKNLHETQSKNERLRVQQESSRNEIAFLREEQDGDKLKIGDLESLLKKTHLNLDAERDRAREFERRLTEERAQRDAVAGQEKQEIQRTINELNREASNSKNELRQARKALSAREVELSTFKDRLAQLEDSLRQMLNIPEDTSSHLIGEVSKIVKQLDQTNMDLDTTRQQLDEHKELLAHRDGLLEDAAFESKRLEDMIEREQLNRRQDKHSFEQALKSHEQASRLAGQNNARIAELEQARLAHRKQLSTLEAQYKDQLAERNQVLLTIWRKFSAMCGPDWAHNHSLINGNLPSQEVIGNILFWPGFSRNLLLAAKQVEGVLSSSKEKIKTIERDLYRNYNALEKEFETRNKKLERIEEHWEKIKLREREIDAGLATSHGIRTTKDPQTQKLRNENKLLKAELRLYQDSSAAAHGSHAGHARSHQNIADRAGSRTSNFSGGRMSQNDGYASMDNASLNGAAGIPNRGSSIRTPTRRNNVTLSRANSASAVETLGGMDGHSTRSNSIASGGRNSGFGFTIGNPGTALAAAQNSSDARGSLAVPGGPTQYPPNGNFSMPPNSSHSNTSEAGTIVAKNEEKKWIHRLREMERRLKQEREQRLVDREGARRRLDERDEDNKRLAQALDREKASRGWRADHVHAIKQSDVQSHRRGDSNGNSKEVTGYLVADEPMLNEFVGQMNQVQVQSQQAQNAQTREEFVPPTPDEQGDPYDDEEGLRTSEEERLMAQPPSVGSSHAQRVAMAQMKQFERVRPENPRSGSSRSSIKERIAGRTPSLASLAGQYYRDMGVGQSQSQQAVRPGSQSQGQRPASQHQSQSFSSEASGTSSNYKPGDRWGRNGCEKDANINAGARGSDAGSGSGSGNNANSEGVRRIMRTASAMAGVGGVS